MYAIIATIIATIIPIGITKGSSHVSLSFFARSSSKAETMIAVARVITESTPAPSPKVSGLPAPRIEFEMKAPIRPMKSAGVT